MEGETCFRITSDDNASHNCVTEFKTIIQQHTAQHGFPDSESKLTCFTCHPNCKLRHGLSERIFLAKMVAKCLERNHFLFDGIWQKCGCVLGFYGYVMICADRI